MGDDDARRLPDTRILVVDDERLAQASLERVLRSEGADVECFSSADEVRKLSSAGDFDAAIVDYWLIDEHGTNAVQMLRQGSLPCASVMVTGSRDPSLIEECIERGAFALLIKPFALVDLLDAVVSAVARTANWRTTIAQTPDDHLGDRQRRQHADPITPVLMSVPSEERREALRTAADQFGRYHDFSDRELQIFHQILTAKPYKQIAEELHVSVSTVKHHAGHIMKKSNVPGRTELILAVFLHDP